MDRAALLYAEVDAICILVLATIYLRLLRNIDKQFRVRLFRSIVVCYMVTFLCDLCWAFVNGSCNAAGIHLNYALNILFFVFTTSAVFIWFLYSEYLQSSALVSSVYRMALCALPALVLIVLAATAPMNHFIFYVDESNMYQRGNGYAVQLIVVSVYLLFTALKAFVSALKPTNYDRKREYLSLSFFVLFPNSFVLLQLFFHAKMPFQCVGYMLNMLIIYLCSLDNKITVDSLTQLNNRDQMIRYLHRKLNSESNGRMLYLLMLDMDNFKSINDRYGHLEGDRALVRVADVLRRSVPRDFFIARYGGDEFIVAGETDGEEEIIGVCNTIQSVMKAESREGQGDYELSVSIGYATPAFGDRSIPNLIRAADERLYKNKEIKKRSAVS